MLFQEYHQAALRSGWFDPGFYFDLLQSESIEIGDTGLSLFEHYATVGWARGLSPSPRFSVARYLAVNGDVAEARIDPLWHYLARGWRERREAFALSEPSGEVQFVGLAEVRPRAGQPLDAQLALARAHGISAFCLHYDAERWREIIDAVGPEGPFCLFLDYRNWARCSAGDDALAAQYGLIHDLLDILADPRHLRVGGRPLLVVHGAERLEQPRLTFDLWRMVARRAGQGGLFVAGPSPQADCGFDAQIEDGAHLSTDLPAFPGFMPDRDLGQWRGCGGNAPEAFRAWLPPAAGQAEALRQWGLPRLIFVDARNGWVEGARAFLEAAGPAPAHKAGFVSEARRLAQAILGSSRLPVLFLCDSAAVAEEGASQRLIRLLGQGGGIACFLLAEVDVEARDLPPRVPALCLSGPEDAGWSRSQKGEFLARLLRARGDLVVVAASLATADLLAPFAGHGHGIAAILQDAPDGRDSLPGLGELARHAHCIFAGSEAVREQVTAAGALGGGNVEVVPQPAGQPDIEHLRARLKGLANEGRRLRLTGGTLGRQAVADDLCVVIPSYNHRRYIVAALDSVLAQSLRPKEIRIIDDGSGDGSAELVRSLASAELGIIVRARENRGAHATINEAVAETACPIVAVINSDDCWHPLRVEELIGPLRRGGADIVFSRLRFMGTEDRSEEKRLWYEQGIADYRSGSPLWLALMFCNFFFTTSNLIARREGFLDLGGFGPLRYCHDLDYMLKAILAGQKVEFVEQALCDYRVHATNTIDEDVDKVLIEEAWIMAKTLRRTFGQISEVEKLAVAQRVCDKGLASRVLGLLNATAPGALPIDDSLLHSDAHFGKVAGSSRGGAGDAIDKTELVHEMARLIGAQRPERQR